MEEKDIQDIRDGFDELFLGSADKLSSKTEEIFQTLGIKDFADIYLRYKKYGFAVSQKVLQDLVKVSFVVYQNLDNLPIQKKVILPSQNGSYKFIITSLPHETMRGKTDIIDKEETNTLFLVCTEDREHKEIARRMGLKGEISTQVNVLGGAWIDIDHKDKILNIRDDSGAYGSCSNQMVEWMLQDYKNQGYEIHINMTKQGEFFENPESAVKEIQQKEEGKQKKLIEYALLDKKLELLHQCLIPSGVPEQLVKELSRYQEAFTQFQKIAKECTGPFEEKYIEALRKFRDILLANI